MELESRHHCFIYEGSPLKQVPALAAVIQQKLHENYRCLYLNSPPMVACVRSHLEAAGNDVAHHIAKGDLVLTSETAVLPDGSFDMDLMMHKLEDALDQAVKDGYQGLFATGDMSWEFGGSKDKDNFGRLLEYEWRLEKLFRRRKELSGICQYHRDTLPIEAVRKGLLSHKTLFINETLFCINQHYTQSEIVAEETSDNSDLDAAITGLLKGS